MNTKIKQAIIGGIVASIAMSIFMFLITFVGLPKMNPPAVLSGMMGMPLIVGWILHLMIGVIFALTYALLLFNLIIKSGGVVIRGLIFGVIVFIFAQIAFAALGAIMGGMPAPEGSMAPMIIGSLLSHIIYGLTVTFFVK
jgi:hypothetical protein